jgi:hypothetical protein
METAFIEIGPTRRRATDPRMGAGTGPPTLRASFGTPPLARTATMASVAPTPSVLGRDWISRLQEWWQLVPIGAPVLPPVASSGLPSSISALDAVHAMMELFGIPMVAVASASGIGRTTPLHWQRTGSVPRPSTVSQLWRLFGLGTGLKTVLGVAGTQSWLRSGSPSPLLLLERGDTDAFERRASAVIFNSRAIRPFQLSFATVDEGEVEMASSMDAARASRRRSRRGRLG